MGASSRHTRLEYDYITYHQGYWRDHVAKELATIMRISRQMELQCRDTVFFWQFMPMHQAMVTFVQERSDEGHQTSFDISRTLAEIKAFYEAYETFNRHLLQTGGLRP